MTHNNISTLSMCIGSFVPSQSFLRSYDPLNTKVVNMVGRNIISIQKKTKNELASSNIKVSEDKLKRFFAGKKCVKT